MKKLLVGLALFGVIAATLAPPADAEVARTNPVVIIGLDGGEWSVIRKMWDQGKLPNLRKLSEGGVSDAMTSHYGESPVIWTSIATGMKDTKHGITGFTVFSDDGDVPFSSTLRKVPALWNMLTLANRKVAVLSWWATWPAETVNGYIVSEKGQDKVPNRVSPASWEPTFAKELDRANAESALFKKNDDFAPEDRMSLHFAKKLSTEKLDLLMVYFRGTDSVSHKYWKWWEPEAFDAVNPESLAKFKDKIPNKYTETDQAIGQIMAAYPANTNFFIMSDHGFHAATEEPVKITLDLNALMKEVGLLTYAANGTKVDCSKSVAYTHKTPVNSKKKRVRVCLSGRDEGATATDKAAAIKKTKDLLGQVTYENGTKVFTFREPTGKNDEADVDLVLEVTATADDVSKILLYQGREIDGVVGHMSVVTGSHPESPPGIFIAYGPDINPKASAKGIDIHDITPTMLYALNLPVAQDFDGRPWISLFNTAFQAKYPMQSIKTYGVITDTKISTSSTDQATMEQLRELGYIE